MNRTLLLAYLLYRELVVYNLIFVAVSIPWLLYLGQRGYVTIFWIKVLGFALSAIFYWFFRKERLLFFHNFRLTRWQLLGIAAAMDGLQTFIVLTLVQLLR